jgi:TolB protein
LEVLAVAVALLAAAAPAQATIPGTNGKIAFTSTRDGNKEIYVVNADGSGETNLTNHLDDDFDPEWSPDGQRIAFTSNRDLGSFSQYPDLWIMNADGSGASRVTPVGTGVSWAEWFPDGSRILFFASGCRGSGGLCGVFSVNPAGGGFGFSDEACCFGPELTWSAYGEPIAYTGQSGGRSIETVNPNGSGHGVLWSDPNQYISRPSAIDWSPDVGTILFDDTSGLKLVGWPNGVVRDVPGTSSGDFDPTWSPDGTRFAVSAFPDNRIATLRTDGTERITLTDGHDSNPDWQTLNPTPVPRGYARPLAASPIRSSLVPAYYGCDPSVANRQHGPPLDQPSCNPPRPYSTEVTVGTFDANGASPGFVGRVNLVVRPGNPATQADEADVDIAVSLTDIRCRYTIETDPDTEGFPCRAGAMADYTGELQLRAVLQITDKWNSGTSGDGPGTIEGGVPLRATIPCSATPADPAGAMCGLATTVDSLVPGMVKERVRSVWTDKSLEVRDGGVDGDVDNPAGNESLFAVQGLFVP